MSFALSGKGRFLDLINIDRWEELVRLAYLYDWKAPGPESDTNGSTQSEAPAEDPDGEQPDLPSFTFQLPEELRPRPLPGDSVLNPYLCNGIRVSDEDAADFADALERALPAITNRGPETVRGVEALIDFCRAGAFTTI